MAIRKPTNLFINVSADLQVDQGNGRSVSQQLIGYTEQLPYSSYSTGSLELDPADPEKSFGELTNGVFLATQAVSFRLENNTDVINSKIFVYNGDVTTVHIANTSNSIVTLEYILGSGL